MRLLVPVIALALLMGCAHNSGSTSSKSAPAPIGEMSLGELAASNQSKIAQLSVGMTKQQVANLMGKGTAKTHDDIVNNPWSVETFSGKDGKYEILFYITRKNQPFTPVRKSLATPLVFKGGRLVGWGEGALPK